VPLQEEREGELLLTEEDESQAAHHCHEEMAQER